jgi:hypothetical protein
MSTMDQPPFPRASTVFVDESKSKGYVIVATAVAPGAVQDVRQRLRKLPRRGQRRIHFTRESDASRRTLIRKIATLDVVAVSYRVDGLRDHDARRRCLEALVADLCRSGTARLVLERDESVAHADRQILRAALAREDARERPRYEHADGRTEELLWVTDAVAWCIQAGRHWRGHIAPLLVAEHDLSDRNGC